MARETIDPLATDEIASVKFTKKKNGEKIREKIPTGEVQQGNEKMQRQKGKCLQEMQERRT